MVVALAPASRLAVPAYLLTVAGLAGFTGAFGWALHYLHERVRLPLALTAALLWTTLEWGLARPGDLGYNWLGLGYALAPYPILAGAADLVGARGLTFWIAAVNGILAMALLRIRAPTPAPVRQARLATLLGAAVLLVAGPAAYGAWRAHTLVLRPAARVAVIQPNVPQAIRLEAAAATDAGMAALARLTLATAEQAPQLVAWPEVALATVFDTSRLDAVVRDLSRRAGAPVLVGAYGDATGARLFNSAFLVGPEGWLGPRYDKQRLVPFVERVPFAASPRRFGGLHRGLVAPLYATPGPAGDAQGGARFGVLICYESAFSDLARGYRRAGADFLVNITNDAWFGRDTWYGRTTALWQHPAHLTLRAIEYRVGIARAANTGISMFIDPTGRTHHATALFTADAVTATVLTTDHLTLFLRWGDWLATLAALASATLLLAARLRGTSRADSAR